MDRDSLETGRLNPSHFNQEGLSADEKLMEATHYGMRRLRERFKGIGHGWPFTLTAILVKVEAS